MSQPKPICVKCQKEMRIDIITVHVVLMAWEPPKPYEIWQGDQWKCPGCGVTIVTGFGWNAIAKHHEPGFAEDLSFRRADKQRPAYDIYKTPGKPQRYEEETNGNEAD